MFQQQQQPQQHPFFSFTTDFQYRSSQGLFEFSPKNEESVMVSYPVFDTLTQKEISRTQQAISLDDVDEFVKLIKTNIEKQTKQLNKQLADAEAFAARIKKELDADAKKRDELQKTAQKDPAKAVAEAMSAGK